ncbi:MAG: MNIO family bufferin maturase, partial [Myxococcota bacterium]
MQRPLFGVGYRTQHAGEIARAPGGALDWFEIVSDNYLGVGGPRRAQLEKLRAERPVAMHGVSLGVAGSGPLDAAYLSGLRELASWLEPAFVSDHLCWTALGGFASHDLLPVAYTREVLAHVAVRVMQVQEALGRTILLENPTAYVAFRAREMDEASFLAALCRETGCGVLLDVNNLVVNAANLGDDPAGYLTTLPDGAVGYMHLAGHAVLPDVRIDTHDAAVPSAVWQLFDSAARRFPGASVIIERDDQIPSYEELVAEAELARTHHRAAVRQAPREDDTPQAGRSPARSQSKANEERSWPALQREFFARLVDKPLGFEHEGLGALLDEGLPVRAPRGMRVYSDAYSASLRSALATNFVALARVLSPADFDRLAAAYLRAHPPRGHDFQSLGNCLAEFVACYPFEHDYGVPREVLSELARLEQAQLEVQDAPDAESIVGPEQLAAIDPEAWPGVRIRFAPALRLVRARHDVAPVIEAVAEGRDPERPVPGEVAYRVARAGIGVRTERLTSQEAVLFEALLAGASFAAA